MKPVIRPRPLCIDLNVFGICLTSKYLKREEARFHRETPKKFIRCKITNHVFPKGKVNNLDRPLVAGCSTSCKPSLHVSRWDTDQAKRQRVEVSTQSVALRLLLCDSVWLSQRVAH